MEGLLSLIVFIFLSAIFALLMVAAGFICQYKNECKEKNSTYECGVMTINDSRINFDVKYFNYVILFLVFDIETIFLYPFALYINQLKLFAVVEAFLFILMLLLGLFIAIRKKLLRWV